MAERHQQQQPTEAIKSYLPVPKKGATPTSKILAIITLFPVGSVLLCLAGLVLVGTLIGLAVATPLFVIFSPILVPAALTIAAAVAGFLTAGAFGITAVSSLSWMFNYFRKMGAAPKHMEQVRRKAQDTAGQKAREAGLRAHEAVKT
ncbi:unnamed protein product [Ilex paraguariensis]|uniref:Oleosin n=1 Tax=Ilex paraguariensis TaxID=185542 RepID=A0ABC8R3H8_9AQUA